MPFPLPIDPEFRKEVVRAWLYDVADRLRDNQPGAEESWRVAQNIYLSLPPGQGDDRIERALHLARVKLDQTDNS